MILLGAKKMLLRVLGVAAPTPTKPSLLTSIGFGAPVAHGNQKVENELLKETRTCRDDPAKKGGTKLIRNILIGSRCGCRSRAR
jgi:hypothetical protein